MSTIQQEVLMAMYEERCLIIDAVRVIHLLTWPESTWFVHMFLAQMIEDKYGH